MKISRIRFVIIFLVVAFVFQFISNSILGPEVGLFPENGDFFPGSDSQVAWKRSLAAILYPIKFVLLRPFPSIFTGTIETPPILFLACVLYWTLLALVFHFLLSKLNFIKKA